MTCFASSNKWTVFLSTL